MSVKNFQPPIADPNPQRSASDLVARQALMCLYNELTALRIAPQDYTSLYKQQEFRPGQRISYRVQAQEVNVRDGVKATPESLVDFESSMTLALIGKDFQMSAAELTLINTRDTINQKVEACMSAIALGLERRLYESMLESALSCSMLASGDFPTDPSGAMLILADSHRSLTEAGANQNGRYLFLTPYWQQRLLQSTGTMFNPQQAIGGQFSTGKMARNVMGFTTMESMSIPKLGSNIASATAATPIKILAVSTDTTTQNLMITIEGNPYNVSSGAAPVPIRVIKNKSGVVSNNTDYICLLNQSQQSLTGGTTLAPTDTPVLLRGVVSKGSTNTTIIVNNRLTPDSDRLTLVSTNGRPPAIETIQKDMYVQPVTTLPYLNAGVGMHKSAIQMATVPFIAAPPGNTSVTSVSRRFKGISLTVSSQWDYTMANTLFRIDVLYAFDVPKPELVNLVLAK